MPADKKAIARNTIQWGFLLWLFGYILGFVFFALVPKDMIGWCITPFGLAALLWVLAKKIRRDSFTCYIGLGIVWTVMALLFDYLFIVKLLSAADYYKPDVYLYYALTLLTPIAYGWYKLRGAKPV